MNEPKILDFNEAKKRKSLLENEENFRQLAKKVVAAYHEHGEQAYYHAFISATRGDKEFGDILAKYIEEIVKDGPYVR